MLKLNGIVVAVLSLRYPSRPVKVKVKSSLNIWIPREKRIKKNRFSDTCIWLRTLLKLKTPKTISASDRSNNLP